MSAQSTPDPWKVVGDLCRKMGCEHNWIGGTPHSIKVEHIMPKGERPRDVYQVVDASGEIVATYDWEHEATESAESMASVHCSECWEERHA